MCEWKIRWGWMMLNDGQWGQLCGRSFSPPPPSLSWDSWPCFPTLVWGRGLGLKMRIWGRAEKGLTGSFGPAPVYSQAREFYSDFTEKTTMGKTSVHGHLLFQDHMVRRGSGEVLQSWRLLWPQVTSRWSPHHFLPPYPCLRHFVLKLSPSKPDLPCHLVQPHSH